MDSKINDIIKKVDNTLSECYSCKKIFHNLLLRELCYIEKGMIHAKREKMCDKCFELTAIPQQTTTD